MRENVYCLPFTGNGYWLRVTGNGYWFLRSVGAQASKLGVQVTGNGYGLLVNSYNELKKNSFFL